MFNMQRQILALLGLTALGFSCTTLAQPYPNKPVRVIVSTVPGPLDTFARMVTEKLAGSLNQPFIVENRAGAGGNIAAEQVAKAPADGYTLLFSIDTTFTVNPAIYKKLPFDPVKDFETISVPVTYGQMLAVHPSLPVNSVSELVALAKTKSLDYASGGNGSPSHLSFAYFLSTAGITMTHIPYKGTGQSIVDVMAGQVNAIFAVTTGVLPHVKSGKLKALAVSSAKRSTLAPELPTVAESGYPGFDASFAYALMAPAGTSKEITHLLNAEVQKAMAAPDSQEKNRMADYLPTGLNAQQSTAWLQENRERWGAVVKKAGITID
jgi:tripartite-type tricarboxylate transporter receptor subunit TctC